MAKTTLDKHDTHKAITEKWDAENEVLTITIDRQKALQVAEDGSATPWQDKDGKEFHFFPEYRHEASGVYISRNGAIGIAVELPSEKPQVDLSSLDNMDENTLRVFAEALKAKLRK